jgi:hypothetical protein
MLKIFFVAGLLSVATAHAQFKADNVKYTTVFPEELCKTLMANQDYTSLDVRSQGEYDDTSNVGRTEYRPYKKFHPHRYSRAAQKMERIVSL